MKTGILLVMLCLASACSCTVKEKQATLNAPDIPVMDTIVGKMDIIDDIAGSAYLKRATGYFVIANGDTSDYKVEVSEQKSDNMVCIDIRYNPYRNKSGKGYKERLLELQSILEVALKEYSPGPTVSVGIGRLINTGDLAIDVTKEDIQQYGDDYDVWVNEYKKISSFLLRSKLGRDMDSLFGPYNLCTEEISVEKVFFSTSKELYGYTIPGTGQKNAPDRILDCITWVELKKCK